MPKREITLDKNLQRKDRPYYLNVDNIKSTYRIDEIENFSSIDNIYQSEQIKKILQDPNYFETEYLVKVISNSNSKN